MRRKDLYLADRAWFENGPHKDPINVLDHKMESIYPDFYALNYDLKLIVDKEPSVEEKEAWFYNDSIEKSASYDISVFDDAIKECSASSIFLIGFSQTQFEYIITRVKDTVELIYLFKCPKIKDLSSLSQCRKLKCLHIFWNNSLETLWNMNDNKELKVLSFITCSKLRNVDSLINSRVEYITFDSSDNCGNKKEMLFEAEILECMPFLKHLKLVYKNVNIDY